MRRPTTAARARYSEKNDQSRQTAKTGQTRVARIERPSLFDVFFATREESKSETENGNFNSLENGPEKVTVIRLTRAAERKMKTERDEMPAAEVGRHASRGEGGAARDA